MRTAKVDLWAFALITRENVRTLKRLAQRLFPAVRLYNDSDEIQSTVTELSPSTLSCNALVLRRFRLRFAVPDRI